MKRKVSKKEMEKIVAVFERYEARVTTFTRVENLMDMINCQEGACVMDLDLLREAPDEDFFHDMNGIKKHFDRREFRIKDGFVPRSTAA